MTTRDLSITVRTTANPGDTGNVATLTPKQWLNAKMDFVWRTYHALAAAHPDAVISVRLHNSDTDAITVIDDDGPLEPGDAIVVAINDLVGETWQAWVESLPARVSA